MERAWASRLSETLPKYGWRVPPRAVASVLAGFLTSRAVVVAGLHSGSRFLTPRTPADAWHPAVVGGERVELPTSSV